MANIKPINEVPVVEELAEGDKVLLNRGGVAAQIDASKVGGGGSAAGGVIYADLMTAMGDDTGEATVQAFTDIEMTIPMDYETGKTILLGAGKLSQDFAAMMPGAVAYLTPQAVIDMEQAKVVQAIIAMGGDSSSNLIIVFSDTVMG